jgi:hypothetical protein
MKSLDATLIGGVPRLESYRSHSVDHHARLGTSNFVDCGGFAIDAMAPNPAWPALVAVARNWRFRRCRG